MSLPGLGKNSPVYSQSAYPFRLSNAKAKFFPYMSVNRQLFNDVVDLKIN